MINIRERLFETNSSSCHSIILSSKDRGYDYDLPVDENGTFHVGFGEYGWGPEILRTPTKKISYYITDQINHPWNDEDKQKVLEDFYKKDSIIKLIDLIKSKCPQVKDVKFEYDDKDFYPFGYIDHDSVGTSGDLPIEDYIFNNGAIIIIDNDNEFYYSDYYVNWESKGDASNKNPEELFDI